uniref:F-box domain-containing protein n=1 Tax=Setaria italica TaxID=4555 RepID=K3XRB0_SETIT
MEAAGDEEGPTTYGQIEQFLNSLEGLTAQQRIDCIVAFLISFLPPPLVPAPEVVGDDSDDESFSLTSSDSEASDAGADPAAFHPVALGDGEDHISRLPDVLLSNIISRLATQEAERTVVLSTRWRGVWATTPLLIDDAHLVGAYGPHDIPIVRAVSRCVAAHPGPVRGVRLTGLSFSHEYSLRCLVADLANKDVQDLILFNRPWPLNMPLPEDILRCASLERLYLGLGLFHCMVRDEEVDAMLALCPKLEILSIVMSFGSPSRLRIVSRSLQVVADWESTLDEVVVHDAPCLERLIFQTIDTRRSIKIVGAPRLQVLGFLDLNLHELEIGGIAIKAGMIVRARAMVPSLKVLAVIVRFACNQEAKMLPTLLKCFPCLETLHILLHLKTLMVHGCLVQNNEIGFLQYVIREGKALKAVCLAPSPNNKVAIDMVSAKFGKNNAASGGGSSTDISLAKINGWIFQNAIDMSVDDPFSVDDVVLSCF